MSASNTQKKEKTNMYILALASAHGELMNHPTHLHTTYRQHDVDFGQFLPNGFNNFRNSVGNFFGSVFHIVGADVQNNNLSKQMERN